MTVSHTSGSAGLGCALPQTSPKISERVLEHSACPLCDGESSRVLRGMQYPEYLSLDDLLATYKSSSDTMLMDQLVACNDCQMVYLSPRIKSSIILDSYKSAVDPTFVTQDNFRVRSFRRTLRWVFKSAGIEPQGKNILDIGCAGGAFLRAAQDVGLKPTGIEPSAWLSRYAREKHNLDVREGTLTDHSFADNSFDMISMWDVIEHLTDPGEILTEISRILRPEGVLIVNYPDYGSIARHLLGYKWPFFLSVHLHYFTRQSIKALLAKHKFTTTLVRPYWQTLELGYAVSRAAAYFDWFRFLGKAIGICGAARLPLTYNMGQTLVIARPASNRLP